jgi:uncharacterized protein (DUF2336 family)
MPQSSSPATAPRLGAQDVARLLSDPAPTARAETAGKIADAYVEAALSPSERQLAREIFAALVRDTAVIVREALAERLKNAPDLPRELAVSLARDADSVALPMLRHSMALEEADLLAIVAEAAPRRVSAIAQRAAVSEAVSAAVIDTGQTEAVAQLVGNEGAAIAETDFGRVLREHGEDPAVGERLAQRAQVPPAVAERLLDRLTEGLQDLLAARGDLDPDRVCDLVLQVRDRATLQMADRSRALGDLDRLVAALHKRGRLEPSLVLRAVCAGDLAFFEAAMAQLADVPVGNARILIYDEGELGLASLWRRAGLPEDKLPLARVAVEVVRETQYDGGPNDRPRFAARLLERLLTAFDNDAVWPGDDLGYLIDRLTRCAA